jgi:hypothetical protein
LVGIKKQGRLQKKIFQKNLKKFEKAIDKTEKDRFGVLNRKAALLTKKC